MPSRSLLAMCLSLALLPAVQVRGADPALVAQVPKGVTPDKTQQETVAALAAKVYRLEVGYDKDGNVDRLWLSQHEANRKKAQIATDRPGFGDADAEMLLAFPKLRSIGFEKQPITEKGLEVLKRFSLDDVKFHYMTEKIRPDFVNVVKGMDLRILEIKHNFHADPDVSGLKGFPNLKYLVLDTTAADARCLKLVTACPNVEALELHRPKLTDAQFGQFVDALPKLRWLHLKSDIGGPGALRHLSRLRNLEVLWIAQWKTGPLPFQGGVEHLAGVTSLKYLEINGVGADALEPFQKARPDVKVAGPNNPSRPPPASAQGEVFERH